MSESPEARTRRRWITLGEVVGVLALLISAASFWDSHQERKAAEAAKPAAPVAPLVLAGTVAADGTRIDLRPAAPDQVIQTQTIVFPTEVRGDTVDTTGNARIEASWFDAGLRAALKADKAKAGRHRVAVGIETVFVADGATRTDRAVYDIGYTLKERFLRPDAVSIEGVSLVRRAPDLRKAVDARFAGQK